MLATDMGVGQAEKCTLRSVVHHFYFSLPISLRAQFAEEGVPLNQLHGSDSPETAKKELGCNYLNRNEAPEINIK